MPVASGNSVVSRPFSSFRIRNRPHSLGRYLLAFKRKRTHGTTRQTAQVSDHIFPLVRRGLERRHIRLLFTLDFLVLRLYEQVHCPVEGLQLQIMFSPIAGKSPQRGAISQSNVDDCQASSGQNAQFGHVGVV